MSLSCNILAENMNIVTLIICSLLALAHGQTNNKTSGERQRKIINGWNVDLGERPFQVSLQESHNSFHFCGGSILDRYWVLTAAHCVHGKSVDSIIIIAGTIDLYKPKSTHHVEKIIPQENYNPAVHFRNDIALIRVVEPFDFSTPLIQPVTLWTERTVPDDSEAIVTGWGVTENGQPSILLKAALVYVANPNVCRSTMQSINLDIYPNQICSSHPYKRTGDCNGDSGGPLTVGDKQVGVVSWSDKRDGCASPYLYNIYARVSEYVDWINSIRGSHVRWER